jgi:hypothetical protein
MASAEADSKIRYSPQPFPPRRLPTSIPDPYRIGISSEGIAAAREALVHHTVAKQFSYKVSHANRNRYLVVCRSKDCSFRIRFKIDASGITTTTVNGYPL